MNGFDHLYDESEKAKVRFVGFVSDTARYDFGIVYTNKFFGKPLVTCLQTGRSTLMCSEDAYRLDLIQQAFNINSEEEAQQLSDFFQHNLPSVKFESQY